MHLDTSTTKQGDKTYTRYLLRETYREGKKVRHRTIANLSKCKPEEIEAIRLALRHKKDLSQLTGQGKEVSLKQGQSVGAVWLLYAIARQLGIVEALGTTRHGKLALWQVIARAIDQGSRLSAVRLAATHAACDVLGLDKFDEDDLYDNLDWLSENQALIEQRLLKGMRQREELKMQGFHYITAITKPQVESLLKAGVLQMSLFDQGLAEVQTNDGVRYVLRRNPVRTEEIRKSREEKLLSLQGMVDQQNKYLKEHKQAKVQTALKRTNAKCLRLKLSGWASPTEGERQIVLHIDEEARTEESKLDGCYVLKSDLSAETATKEIIHDRYKDLSLVESAFRSSKTVNLELRPIHVRLATRTRGHVFVVMMAYRIIHELAARWQHLDVTV